MMTKARVPIKFGVQNGLSAVRADPVTARLIASHNAAPNTGSLTNE
jgi:hypothetical protein